MILLLFVSSRISNLLFSFFFFFTKDPPSEVSTQLYVYAICHFFIAFLTYNSLFFLDLRISLFLSFFCSFFCPRQHRQHRQHRDYHGHPCNILNTITVVIYLTSRLFSQSHSFNLVILAHTHFPRSSPSQLPHRVLAHINADYHQHHHNTITIPLQLLLLFLSHRSATLFSNALSLLIQHVPRYSTTLFF